MRSLLLLFLLALPSADASTFSGTYGLYEVRPDERDCAWPMCGGYFVHAVNHAQTSCPDGTTDRWCYVVDIDWAALGYGPTELADLSAEWGSDPWLVGGRLSMRSTPPFGPLPWMRPYKAFAGFEP